MPTQADIKAFEQKYASYMREVSKRRQRDERKFVNRANAGAYLTHDILSDRKSLSGGKKLIMQYGTQGFTLEYTLDDLKKMADATENAKDKFSSREAGIPIRLVIQESREEDREAASAIKAATLYQMAGNILDFRVKASGDTKNAPPYYKVRVRLDDWKNAITGMQKKDYSVAAKNACMGYVSFDCNCGRYIYWYQYLATIGNFDIAPGETVFPKIRNPKLTGICCKHILKTLMTVQTGIIQARVAKAMEKTAVDKDFETLDPTKLTDKELNEMESAGTADNATTADFNRFLKDVKAFNAKQKQPGAKKAIDDLKKKHEVKMKKTLAEKQAAEAVAKAEIAKNRELENTVRKQQVAMLNMLKAGGQLNDANLSNFATMTNTTPEHLMKVAKEEGLL